MVSAINITEIIDTQPPLPFHHLDNAAFNAVLFEYEHGPLSFDFDRLESLSFNPIEQLPSVMENYFINNLDPDINFSKLMPPNSSYMVENEINNLLRDSSDCSEMSFLHINCRSLFGNFDKFRVLTANLSNSFSVSGLSKTWLNDNTHDLVNLPGYDFISNHRQNKVGGGVGLYIRESFRYELIHDCKISNPEVIESLFVEILNPNGKTLL
jgi:hypothetical protein